MVMIRRMILMVMVMTMMMYYIIHSFKIQRCPKQKKRRNNIDLNDIEGWRNGEKWQR